MIIGVILKLQIFNRFFNTILHHCTKRISIEQVINVSERHMHLLPPRTALQYFIYDSIKTKYFKRLRAARLAAMTQSTQKIQKKVYDPRKC